MVLVFGWILFSTVIALLGSNRKIGAALLFLISLLFSPVCGLILVILIDISAPKTVIVENKKAQLQLYELGKLKSFLDEGKITIEEFQTLSKKVLA